ncbi:MAG: hypothetical protein E6356_17040 [Terrisporobacter othiniensis]|nr:hypothetical protein [Terrisporobacter othiniensis]MDU6996564.1 hypothetical protein [Terrisporobacter othiniensis]
MFCKIRKGKWGYSIYACDRKRVNGKVVSNDIKIDTYAWHSLYEDGEEIKGLIYDIPVILMRSITAKCIRNKDVSLDFDDVVEKLIKVKKEYYPTYKDMMLKVIDDIKKEEENNLIEYENFKNKYRSLHYKEIMEKYQEGYDRGLLDGIKVEDKFFNRGSDKKLEMNDSEKKLLKEAFKLLAFKFHPDRGGSTEKMASINNLKEKILK